MVVRIRFYFYFLNILILVRSGYPPQGDEVQMGSVLLPATRRGRYLANIVRRQAVDGTGIKFNKDADRMNAEAKKKVDVLSEELLPYIIAEQERRTTLYKRVMTAIQNGEKGVTIAEIRNKPPLIIRKGLMYRCPANRAPKEPDGSGVIMCEQDIEPTPVMYDSCLSAEDKELYVADSRYFFCNRHKVEGPDLPRNGSTVIGCAPLERTSLNYTTGKCALEDTDDVVVHYRYYPDKTYKFVTELDPDHEVCDHWNPCQIGYIYSLPSPDQAMPANELWHDYEERPDEYEKDEIVPPIPEDNPEEYVTDQSRSEYVTSIRKLEVPEGYKFHGIGRYSLQNIRTRLTVLDKVLSNYTNIRVKVEPPPAARRRQAEEGATAAPASETPASDAPATGASSGGANAATAVVSFVKIQLFFSPITSEDITHYYVRFESATKPGSYKYKTIVILYRATAQLAPVMEDVLPGQTMNTTIIPLRCGKCIVKSMMVRAVDGGIANLDMSRYRVRTENDHKNIEVELGKTFFHDFGDYFIVLQTEDGNEERIKALSVNGPDSSGGDVKCSRRVDSIDVGTHIDNTIKWECEDCTLEDVLCEGESVIPGGRVSIVGSSRFVSFNFPSFENENACVYIGIFSSDNKKFKRTLQIIDNNSPSVHVEKMDAQPPVEGTQFEIEVPYQCQGDCSIEKVTLDGVALEAMTRRSVPASGIAFFLYTPTALTIRITSFSASFMGIYQAVFNVASGSVTKTVLEIKDPNDKSELATNDAETTAAAEAASAAEGDTTPAAGAEGDTTAADAAAAEGETAAGEATTAAEGDGAPAEDASPADGEASPADDAPPAEGETEAPAK